MWGDYHTAHITELYRREHNAMKINTNVRTVEIATVSMTTPANANATPAHLRTTSLTSTKAIIPPSSVDMMALAYCVAEEKGMDIKVVYDLLVTAAEILQKGDVGEIWERVKQLTRGGDDEGVQTTQKRSLTHKCSTDTPDNTPEDDPTSTSAVIIADSDETEEEAYELGYQNGLQDGESGFGRIQRRWQGRGKDRNGLASAYKAGYELGYATGRDSVSRKTRDKRTDAESCYNGYDVEDDTYDDYD